jgi:hypothetical protein
MPSKRSSLELAGWPSSRPSGLTNETAGIVIDRGEEIGGVLDVRGALRRVAHDGVDVGLEVADVAVGRANLNRGVSAGGIVLESNGRGVGPSVVGP